MRRLNCARHSVCACVWTVVVYVHTTVSCARHCAAQERGDSCRVNGLSDTPFVLLVRYAAYQLQLQPRHLRRHFGIKKNRV